MLACGNYTKTKSLISEQIIRSHRDPDAYLINKKVQSLSPGELGPAYHLYWNAFLIVIGVGKGEADCDYTEIAVSTMLVAKFAPKEKEIDDALHEMCNLCWNYTVEKTC